MSRTGPVGSERCAWSGMPRHPLSLCVVGERLCSTEEATAGSGTYTRHGFIFSSLAGCLERKNEDNEVSVAAARLLLPRAECLAPRLHGLPGACLGCGGELDSGAWLVILRTSCALC